MPQQEITMKLSSPGMTALHKVGLAGLYMTLQKLDQNNYKDIGGWNLFKDKITIHWHKTPKELFQKIIGKAFQISKEGMIDFLTHRHHVMGVETRFLIHRLILSTYLQPTYKNCIAFEDKKSCIAIEYDSQNIVTQDIKKVVSYKHQQKTSCKLLFDEKGFLKKNISLVNWLFPGGTVRHVVLTSKSQLTNSFEKALLLFFTPTATIYFSLNKRTSEGKYDNKRCVALIYPQILDLEVYSEYFNYYLRSPAAHLYEKTCQTDVDKQNTTYLYANDAEDAVLKAFLVLELNKKSLQLNEIGSCLVNIIGRLPWNEQQKRRSNCFHIKKINVEMLELFNQFLINLPNQRRLRKAQNKKEKDSIVIQVNNLRGLIAHNICKNQNWFYQFSSLMLSQKLAKRTRFECRGLKDMIKNNTLWSDKADQMFIEAIHIALRNRYGALAERATKKGEKPNFDREFEKIRTSLLRTKNAQTLRAELADIFSRGGINKVLQKNWSEILPLYTGNDWQKAKDLALLGLASYSGKGSQEVENTQDIEID